MDKLLMRSTDGVKENIENLSKLFPNCVTESYDKMGGGKTIY